MFKCPPFFFCLRIVNELLIGKEHCRSSFSLKHQCCLITFEAWRSAEKNTN